MREGIPNRAAFARILAAAVVGLAILSGPAAEAVSFAHRPQLAGTRPPAPLADLEDLRDVLRGWQAASLPLGETNWFPAGSFVVLPDGDGLRSVVETAVPDAGGSRRLYVSEDSRTGDTLVRDGLGLPVAALPGEGVPSPALGGPWDPARVGLRLDVLASGESSQPQDAGGMAASVSDGPVVATAAGLHSSAGLTATAPILRPATNHLAGAGGTPTNATTAALVPIRVSRTQGALRTASTSSTDASPRDGVLFYDFDAAPVDGVVEDRTGNGNDGAASNCDWTPSGRFNGGAMAFDGNADSVNAGEDVDFPSWDIYSVSLWFRHDGGGDLGPQYGHKMLDKTTWYHDWHLNIRPPGTEGGGTGAVSLFMYEDGAGAGLGDGSANYADDAWHHVVVVRDGGHGELWVDGVLRDQTEGMLSVYSSSALCVGNSYSGDSYQRKGWSGALDEVRVFGRALTVDEVHGLFIRGLPVRLDADGDGLSGARERELGTDPLLRDTDGDGYDDDEEIAAGQSPTDSTPGAGTTIRYLHDDDDRLTAVYSGAGQGAATTVPTPAGNPSSLHERSAR